MADNSNEPIRVICGPTGAGKTRVAHRLAEEFNLTIISADSRQVYRRFEIGTAKPTREERERVRYLGIDVLDPTERGSAAWWAEHANAWINGVEASGRAPVVVGGTGLYLRALFSPLFEEPVLDDRRRAALESVLAELSTDDLRRWVMTLDPPRAHLGRAQLLRAVEIALLTGHRVSDLHTARARPPKRRARYLVVDPGARLRDDIALRTRTMFESGWREEVRALMHEVPGTSPAWNGTGYRTIRALEEGVLSEEEAERRVVTDTRQYAKRQRTWFRHQLANENVTRLDGPHNDWIERACAWWRKTKA